MSLADDLDVLWHELIRRNETATNLGCLADDLQLGTLRVRLRNPRFEEHRERFPEALRWNVTDRLSTEALCLFAEGFFRWIAIASRRGELVVAVTDGRETFPVAPAAIICLDPYRGAVQLFDSRSLPVVRIEPRSSLEPPALSTSGNKEYNDREALEHAAALRPSAKSNSDAARRAWPVGARISQDGTPAERQETYVNRIRLKLPKFMKKGGS